MERNETDPCIQLPTQAWISAFCLMDIDQELINNSSISLKEYVERQKNKTNVWINNPNFPVYNTGFLIMLAYGLLVIPKETIKKLKLKVNSDTIRLLIDKVEITIEGEENKKEDKYECIIRHIRNSLAHAQFEINTVKNNVTFVDKRPDGNFKISITMDINDLKELLDAYFKAFYQEYHQKYITNLNTFKD